MFAHWSSEYVYVCVCVWNASKNPHPIINEVPVTYWTHIKRFYILVHESNIPKNSLWRSTFDVAKRNGLRPRALYTLLICWKGRYPYAIARENKWLRILDSSRHRVLSGIQKRQRENIDSYSVCTRIDRALLSLYNAISAEAILPIHSILGADGWKMWRSIRGFRATKVSIFYFAIQVE